MTRVPVDRRHRAWVSMDRRHHGWVGALFGDGAISIGLGPVRPEPLPAGFQLGYDADGTDVEDLGICRDHAGTPRASDRAWRSFAMFRAPRTCSTA